jgi:hypothetical protein
MHACLHRGEDFVLLVPGLVDKAHDSFFQERRRTHRPPFRDLPLDHPLKLIGKLNRAHAISQSSE